MTHEAKSSSEYATCDNPLPVNCDTSATLTVAMSDLDGGDDARKQQDRLQRLRSEVDETVTILEDVRQKSERRASRVESLEKAAASIDGDAKRLKEAAERQRRR